MIFVLNAYGKCFKFLNTSLSVLKSNVCLYAGIQKMVVTIANREKTQIRLLLQKQSDLGLHCLSLCFLGGHLCSNF